MRQRYWWEIDAKAAAVPSFAAKFQLQRNSNTGVSLKNPTDIYVPDISVETGKIVKKVITVTTRSTPLVYQTLMR